MYLEISYAYLPVHLLQILAQHIKAVLPGLKARISASLVNLAKEHASYGEITESKACVIILMCLCDICK
jgi:hypothetical protein